jgi:hypothetical protein
MESCCVAKVCQPSPLRIPGRSSAAPGDGFRAVRGSGDLSPSRNLFVDGGLPTGKKKSTDNLNFFYTPPRPRIIQSVATQDPDAGLVDLNDGTARFVVNTTTSNRWSLGNLRSLTECIALLGSVVVDL